MAGSTDVPGADPGALVEVDRHDFPGTPEPDIGPAVEIEVELFGGARGPQATRRPVGDVLGGDDLAEGRRPHVGDVDPAKEAVPVHVIRLAPVEMVERLVTCGAVGEPGH